MSDPGLIEASEIVNQNSGLEYIPFLSKGSYSFKLSIFQYNVLKFPYSFNHFYIPCCGMNSAEHCDTQIWIAILGSPTITLIELHVGHIRSLPTTLATIEALLMKRRWQSIEGFFSHASIESFKN